jgi:hypothetical protein
MNIGAAGILIIFFALFIAAILVSLFVASFAAQVFLVILVGTAAGDDEVRWPGDPLYDWFLRVWHFIWILGVWSVPAFFIMKLAKAPPAVSVAGIVALLWLIFPVSVLSSLSAQSNFVIFRPIILWAMLKHFGTLVGFYLITGILLAICTALWYAGILGDHAIALPLAAFAGAMSFLIYARLLGRIGLLVSWYKPGRRRQGAPPPEEADKVQIFDPWSLPEEEDKDPANPEAAPRPPRSKKKPAFKKKRKTADEKAYDPWAITPDEVHAAATTSEPEDPLGPVLGSYGLAAADALPPPPPRADMPDAGLEAYGVAEADAERITPIQPLATPAVAKQELELAIRRRPPPPPARPLTTGVFNFPFYQQCLLPLVGLSLGFLAIGGLLRLLLVISHSFVE